MSFSSSLCGSQAFQLDKTVDKVFFPMEDCMELCDTLRTSFQGGNVWVSTSLGSPSAVSEVWAVFIDRDLP